MTPWSNFGPVDADREYQKNSERTTTCHSYAIGPQKDGSCFKWEPFTEHIQPFQPARKHLKGVYNSKRKHTRLRSTTTSTRRAEYASRTSAFRRSYSLDGDRSLRQETP